MNKNKKLNLSNLSRPAIAVAALSALQPFGLSALCSEAPPARPNIILILADDMGYGDIGPFGSKKNRTPNLDRMAAEGMKLTSFYCAPLCTASRTQFMTGCYAKRLSMPSVLSPMSRVGISAKEHTVAELLKTQGYVTMIIGKWHLGDQPAFLPLKHGFDAYFGLPYSNDMDGGGPQHHPPLPLVRDATPIEVITPEGQTHLEERYTDAALQFIRARAAANNAVWSGSSPIQNRVPSEARSLTSKIENSQPFFLYFAHTAVHKPLHPGPKFAGKSANGPYGDWVEEIDWSVGRVLDTVRELGLSQNTLVIYTSDNGPYQLQPDMGGVAGPLRGAKRSTYEGGMREPTIAWWPGKVPAGASTDALAGNIDILPTFVKLAGGSVPTDNKIDGVDISPVLLGQAAQSTRAAQYYFSGNTLQAVRAGPWKLAIARQNEATSAATANPYKYDPKFVPQLYNLDTDIGERHDVAAAHPDIVKQLQTLITAMDNDLGINHTGPGVRRSGYVEHPVGLWVRGQEPSKETIAEHYDTED